jgi:predicted signal transduction protein with EAL and GGDEF domain
VADVLREGRRDVDLPARLGGEEFGVILPGTDILAGARIADQICNTLAATPVAGVGTVTASFGVATLPEDGTEAKDLMKTADERLYYAKGSGRNQVSYVTISKDVPESTAARLKKLKLPQRGRVRRSATRAPAPGRLRPSPRTSRPSGRD